MDEIALAGVRASFDRILVSPDAAELWRLQQALLVVGTGEAARARTVARAFHGCLRNLESKSASRSASRWGAVLGTAAVGSVSLGEMGDSREAALEGLVADIDGLSPDEAGQAPYLLIGTPDDIVTQLRRQAEELGVTRCVIRRSAVADIAPILPRLG